MDRNEMLPKTGLEIGDDGVQDTTGLLVLMFEEPGCSAVLLMTREPTPFQLSSAVRKYDANAEERTNSARRDGNNGTNAANKPNPRPACCSV